MRAQPEHTIPQTFRQNLRIVSLVPAVNIAKEKETLRQQETAMLAGTALVAPTVPTRPHMEENVMLGPTALKVSFNHIPVIHHKMYFQEFTLYCP